jgi:hypothetical protein
MIAAMMPEHRFSGIALATFSSFAEAVHGPDLALGKSTDLVITRSGKAVAEPIGEGFKPPRRHHRHSPAALMHSAIGCG